MTLTALPPRPVAPAQPADLRDLIREHNRAVRNIPKAIRAGLSTQPYRDDIAACQDLIREWHASPAGRAYAAAVAAYNTAAQAFNRTLAVRANERQTAKTRAHLCPTCFTTLPTSGVCGGC